MTPQTSLFDHEASPRFPSDAHTTPGSSDLSCLSWHSSRIQHETPTNRKGPKSPLQRSFSDKRGERYHHHRPAVPEHCFFPSNVTLGRASTIDTVRRRDGSANLLNAFRVSEHDLTATPSFVIGSDVSDDDRLSVAESWRRSRGNALENSQDHHSRGVGADRYGVSRSNTIEVS
jgi:hypothetical protein